VQAIKQNRIALVMAAVILATMSGPSLSQPPAAKTHLGPDNNPDVRGSLPAQTPEVTMLLKPNNVPAVRDIRWRRVGPELTALHELHEKAKLEKTQLEKSKPGRAGAAPAPLSTRLPYLRISNDMVLIDTVVDGDTVDDVAKLKAALASLGAVDIVAFKRIVSARLPMSSIPMLADIQQLRFSRPSRAKTNAGLVTSQGDIALNTDDARTAFGVDGSGVTVCGRSRHR
jgi:hypothetical protein